MDGCIRVLSGAVYLIIVHRKVAPNGRALDISTSEPVNYWTVNCRCGCFLGFPNRRAAEAERDELTKRYEIARQDVSARNVVSLLAKLETLAEQSRPAIASSFEACDDILRSRKLYRKAYSAGDYERKTIDHAAPPGDEAEGTGFRRI
jgi:hypothetical protein